MQQELCYVAVCDMNDKKTGKRADGGRGWAAAGQGHQLETNMYTPRRHGDKSDRQTRDQQLTGRTWDGGGRKERGIRGEEGEEASGSWRAG